MNPKIIFFLVISPFVSISFYGFIVLRDGVIGSIPLLILPFVGMSLGVLMSFRIEDDKIQKQNNVSEVEK